MDRQPAVGYVAVRLHNRADKAWAVVETPSGAIALDAQLRLLMRLAESEAVDLAAAMTSALEDREADRSGG